MINERYLDIFTFTYELPEVEDGLLVSRWDKSARECKMRRAWWHCETSTEEETQLIIEGGRPDFIFIYLHCLLTYFHPRDKDEDVKYYGLVFEDFTPKFFNRASVKALVSFRPGY